MNVHMYVGSAVKEENGDPTSGPCCLRTAKKSKWRSYKWTLLFACGKDVQIRLRVNDVQSMWTGQTTDASGVAEPDATLTR